MTENQEIKEFVECPSQEMCVQRSIKNCSQCINSRLTKEEAEIRMNDAEIKVWNELFPERHKMTSKEQMKAEIDKFFAEVKLQKQAKETKGKEL